MDLQEKRAVHKMINDLRISFERKLEKHGNSKWRLAIKRLNEIERQMEKTGEVDSAVMEELKNDLGA